MGVQGKPIRTQARQVIKNVIEFTEMEKQKGEVGIRLDNAQNRVATATGVSLRTVQRIYVEIASLISQKVM